MVVAANPSTEPAISATPAPPMPGPKKAAIILLQLPKDVAADVLRHLPRDLVDPIMAALANLGTVPKEVREQVAHEAETLLRSVEQLVEGGWEIAQQMLESAYGPQRAQDMLRRLSQQRTATTGRPFGRLSHTPPEHIAALIADEMPQTVAIVLAHLDPRLSAQVLAVLPEEVAAEATRRLARLESLPQTVVANLERTLESRLAMTGGSELGGGLDLVVPVLNATDTQREQAILERIAERDPDLAEQIRNQLFTFADLATLDDGTLQNVIRRLEARTLAVALRGADAALKERFFANMSENQAEIIKEEMETLGRVRVRDVEVAQHEITDTVHQLEEAGEIVIPRGGTEEEFVE